MGAMDVGLDKVIVGERRATYIRLALVAFCGGVYGLWMPKVGTFPALAYAILVAAAIYSASILAFDPYERFDFLVSSTFITLSDAGLVLLWLFATGGFESPFYPLWYASLVALAFRFGHVEALLGSVLYSALYVSLLAVLGELMPHLLAVTVRVGFIFIIGALGALLSLVALEQTVEKERYQEVAAERKRTTSLLSATLDSTADGILVVDREGRIVAHNDRFRQMWGIPPDLLASGSDEEAIQFVLDQLQDPSAFQKRIAYLYDHPEEESRDLLEFQDGRIFERYSRPQVLDGEIVGRVWSFRDVTEQERTRRALESSNRELEQFAYAASHDLQEPLRMVKGYLDLLERRYGEELDEDAHEFIDYAVDGATRMSELIRGLLQYSRVGRSGGEMEPTPLVEPLHEALAHLQPQIDELDATVDHADLPVALADRTQLTFLLQNLIGNALKFHGDEAPPHVRITASGGDDGWVIAVADNGQGIPEGDQERIFEIFERGTARDVDGAGIGLATCKRIVERHGGEIWVESEVGEGSTFYFTLEDAGNGGSAQDHGSG